MGDEEKFNKIYKHCANYCYSKRKAMQLNTMKHSASGHETSKVFISNRRFLRSLEEGKKQHLKLAQVVSQPQPVEARGDDGLDKTRIISNIEYKNLKKRIGIEETNGATACIPRDIIEDPIKLWQLLATLKKSQDEYACDPQIIHEDCSNAEVMFVNKNSGMGSEIILKGGYEMLANLIPKFLASGSPNLELMELPKKYHDRSNNASSLLDSSLCIVASGSNLKFGLLTTADGEPLYSTSLWDSDLASEVYEYIESGKIKRLVLENEDRVFNFQNNIKIRFKVGDNYSEQIVEKITGDVCPKTMSSKTKKMVDIIEPVHLFGIRTFFVSKKNQKKFLEEGYSLQDIKNVIKELQICIGVSKFDVLGNYSPVDYEILGPVEEDGCIYSVCP